MFLWGVTILVKHRRESGVLHHRVPDFQLVYCGPDRKLFGQAIKQVDKRGKRPAFVLADRKDGAVKQLKQHKRTGR